MESSRGTSEQALVVSDTELLRRIGHDLRSIYTEVFKQPLPRKIEATLSRIEREQGRAGYQRQSAVL